MELLHHLQYLGLTEGEAKVYLALLEQGPSTVGPIVKKSGIAYSNIYEVLNRLIEKGFVSFFIKEKTKHFQAAEPNRIFDYLKEKETALQQQQKDAQQVVKALQFLKAPGKQEAEVFMGSKGLRTAYEKLLLPFKKGTTAHYIYVYDPEWKEFTDNFYLRELPWMFSGGVHWRGISNEEYRTSRLLTAAVPITKSKFVSFPLPANIDFYQDKALIVSWSKKPVGILIHSEDFVRSFTKFFEQLWKVAKE